MSRIVNGIVTVPAFTPTGNPGEYTFTGATFASQSDTTGNGAFLVEVGFIVYVPTSDPNTFTQIPGVVHRYRLTAVNIIDAATIDGTILWDEDGPELDAPTNGIDSIIAMPTSKRRLGLPVDPAIYVGLSAGAATAAYNIDTEYILDNDVDVFSVDPATPVIGQFWFNSTDLVFRGYNGSAIVTMSTGIDPAELDTKVSKTGDTLTGNLTFDGVHTVTGIANPTHVSDAATKGYVDSALSGLTWIQPVKQIVTDKSTYSNPLVVGDRLIDNNDNKIYTVTAGGANGATATFDSGLVPVNADAVFTSDDETGYVFASSGWVQFTGPGAIAAGFGLTKVGNTLNVRVGTGIVLSSGAVALDETVTDALYVKKTGDTMTGLLHLSGDPIAPLDAATKQYVDSLASHLANGYFLYTAPAAATSHTVTHNMGNKYQNVTVIDFSDEVILPQSIVFNDVNSLTVTFNSAITCKVVVSGFAAT